MDGGSATAGAFGTAERPVAAPEGNGSDCVFDGVVVDWQVAAVGVADQGRPALEAIVDGAGQAAAVGGPEPLGDEPVVQRSQARFRFALAQYQTGDGIGVARLRFERIQLTDAAQRLFGHRVSASGLQVEEFSSAMRQAGQLDDTLLEARFVSAVVIDHQMAAPVLQEVACMHAAAAGLIVEHDDSGHTLQIVAAIGP